MPTFLQPNSNNVQLRPRLRSGGFTLLEILITIGIVVLVMGLAVSKMGSGFDSQAFDAAKQLSSTVRYLYNKAASENLTMRIVFDFENNSYQVEASSSNFLIESETSKKPPPKKTDAPKSDAEPKAKAEAVFAAVDAYMLEPTVLPQSVFLKDLFTEHDEGPVTHGKAYIYILPSGYVERSIVNFKNENDSEHVAVVINPITGSSKIFDEYRELKK